jgi:hypothetical protein
LALWFAQSPVKTVKAVYESYSDIGLEAPDVAEILIGFEDRRLASVHLNFFRHPQARLTELLGTEGMISIDLSECDAYTLTIHDAASGVTESSRHRTERDDMYVVEDEHFLRCVAEDAPVTCTIAEARKSVEVIHTAMSSKILLHGSHATGSC